MVFSPFLSNSFTDVLLTRVLEFGYCQLIGRKPESLCDIWSWLWVVSTGKGEGHQEDESKLSSVEGMKGVFHLLLLLIKLVRAIPKYKSDVYSDDLTST